MTQTSSIQHCKYVLLNEHADLQHATHVYKRALRAYAAGKIGTMSRQEMRTLLRRYIIRVRDERNRVRNAITHLRIVSERAAEKESAA